MSHKTSGLELGGGGVVSGEGDGQHEAEAAALLAAQAEVTRLRQTVIDLVKDRGPTYEAVKYFTTRRVNRLTRRWKCSIIWLRHFLTI